MRTLPRNPTAAARGWPMLLALLIGCGPDTAGPHDAGPLQPAETLAVDGVAGVCPDGGLSVLHAAAWPGGGVGLLVRARAADGKPAAGLTTADFSLRLAGGEPLTLAVVAAPAPRRVVALLVDAPADPRAATELRRAAAAFARARPAGEALALYRRAATVDQVVGFTTVHERVGAALDAADDDSPAAPRMALDTAIAAVVAETSRLYAPAEPTLRAVIVVSAVARDAVPTLNPAGDLTLYLLAPVPNAAPATSAAGAHVAQLGWQTEAELDAAFAQVAADLEVAAAGLYALGACPNLPAGTNLTLQGPAGAPCTVTLPAGPAEDAALPCVPDTVAAGARPLPERIEFRFSAEERTRFDELYAGWRTDDFDLSVRLGAAAETPARAHLRGQTTLGCARKSFAVNLKGPEPRTLLAGVANDEFLLLSMCNDDRYFQQYAANRIATDLGIFPARFGFVELLVDGSTWGVYLLIEKADEAVLRENARVAAVLRRRFEPSDIAPDVAYPPDEAAAAPTLAAFLDLPGRAASLSGASLLADLLGRVDLDAFLGWLALQSLLQNGDYADEVFFFGTEAVRAGTRCPYFGIAAWDMDDPFSPCHHEGRHEIPDPHGISYCAEGNLERVVLADPVLYARFADRVADVIAAWPTARLRATLDDTAAALLPFFARADVCAAMSELLQRNPDARDPAVAQADIRAHMEAFATDFALRRTLLLERVAAFRAGRRQP